MRKYALAAVLPIGAAAAMAVLAATAFAEAQKCPSGAATSKRLACTDTAKTNAKTQANAPRRHYNGPVSRFSSGKR